MACPFFEPRFASQPGLWKDHFTHRPRLPLGDDYSGFCRVLENAPHTPPEEHQRELCNCGYARDLCSHFPASCLSDAVRFSVISDLATRLRLVYILEKDHAPLSHGELEFSIPEHAFSVPPPSELLAIQARAFVESYLRLRSLAER